MFKVAGKSTKTRSKGSKNEQATEQMQLLNQKQVSMTQINPVNEHNQDNKLNYGWMAKFTPFLCLLLLFIANLYVYSILIPNMEFQDNIIVKRDKTSNDSIRTHRRMQQIKQINRSINSYNSTSVDRLERIKTKIPSPKQRVQLGSPNVEQAKLTAWTIGKNSTECTNSCAIISGLFWINQHSMRSIQNLLQNAIDKAIILARVTDIEKIAQIANSMNKKYSISVPHTYQNIDSTYNFINHHLSNKDACQCDKVIYFSSSLIIRNSTSRTIKQLSDQLSQSQVAVLNTFVPLRNKYQSEDYINNEQASDLYLNMSIGSLPLINSMSLQDIPPELYSKYLYIFDKEYLKYISPLNFAYYVKYSLEEILILPILAIVQKTSQLKQIQNITYGMPSQFRYANQPIYKLHEQKSTTRNKNNKALCFVSYTSAPSQTNFQQISTYLDSINNLDKANLSLFVIIYIPYQYSNLFQISNNISQVYDKIKNMNSPNLHIKLRIRANKTLSAHAVYQSTYNYCPYQSLMISSRHNVRFLPSFGQELAENMNEKMHYYHANYRQLQKKQDNILVNVPKYQNRYQVRKSNLFRQHFRHIQIYTNKLMRTTTFWVLKNGQLDFYQTQAAFFILMMETIKLQFHYINKTLYHVTNRGYTSAQQQQIEVLKKYVQYSAVGDNLIPYTYNCLENRAYSRFAPDLLPKIIHQIWFGKDKISEVRMHLHRTIKQINPSFHIYLWRTPNITRENFPRTYLAIRKTLQYHKSYPKSLMALASDLLRYEAVYLYGGVYVDFKMEALRPIDPFLKYQSFFLDAGNGPERFGEGQAVGVGVFGATQNNYHLKLLIHSILEMDNINFRSKRISQLTGGFVVRKAYKTSQFFTVMGLGYQLFYPRPYDNPVNECGGVDKTFSIDQTVYQINDILAKAKIKIGIPCKQYPQSYFVNFTPLARTWIGSKRNVG